MAKHLQIVDELVSGDINSNNPVSGRVVVETINNLLIKKTTEKADFHHITNSADYRVIDFGMEGKTEQESTSGKNLFDVEKAKDESNYVWGSRYPYFPVYVGAGNTITFSCNLSNAADYTRTVIIVDAVDGNNLSYIWHNENTALQKEEVTITSPNDYMYIRLGCLETEVLLWLDYIKDIQIELGSVATEYEPYSGGVASPSPEHKQEIVNAGVYNEETGRHEHKCFITDENEEQSQQITLTSPVPLTKWDKLVKRDGVYGWSVNSVNRQLIGTWVDLVLSSGWMLMSSNEGVYVYQINMTDKLAGLDNIFCTTYYHNKTEAYGSEARLNKCSGIISGNRLFFGTDIPTLDEWKAHLDENPLDVWYQTAEEQAFIPLPDEEQELLRNLETYYGVTNVYNEQGCPIWLTYAEDIGLHLEENYVSKTELEELKAQVLNLQTAIVNKA